MTVKSLKCAKKANNITRIIAFRLNLKQDEKKYVMFFFKLICKQTNEPFIKWSIKKMVTLTEKEKKSHLGCA